MIRDYIRNEEAEDKRLDQMNLWRKSPPLGGTKKGRVSDPVSRFERLTT